MITGILTAIFGILLALSLVVIVIGFIVCCCEGTGWLILVPLVLAALSCLVLWEISWSKTYEIKIVAKQQEQSCEK